MSDNRRIEAPANSAHTGEQKADIVRGVIAQSHARICAALSLRAQAVALALEAGFLPVVRTIPQFLGEEGPAELRAAPGRFEGEPFYIAWFYDAVMNGDGEPIGDEERTEADLLDVTETERDAFGLDDSVTCAAVTYSESGFVGLTLLTAEEADKLRAPSLDETAEEEPEEDPRTVTYTAPSYWASYLVNGDASGLEDSEQAAADAWLESISGDVEPGGPVDCQEAGFCSHHDADGLALAGDCAVYTFFRKV